VMGSDELQVSHKAGSRTSRARRDRRELGSDQKSRRQAHSLSGLSKGWLTRARQFSYKPDESLLVIALVLDHRSSLICRLVLAPP
jgi:hypothetical protein